MQNLDVADADPFADEMQVDFQMLCSLVLHRVARGSPGSLVLHRVAREVHRVPPL